MRQQRDNGPRWGLPERVVGALTVIGFVVQPGPSDAFALLLLVLIACLLFELFD